MPSHIDNATQRALACEHTAASFATLDKHHSAGRFNRDEALRLLRRNARDHTPYTPPAVRDAVAQRLLDTWQASRHTDDTHSDTE